MDLWIGCHHEMLENISNSDLHGYILGTSHDKLKLLEKLYEHLSWIFTSNEQFSTYKCEFQTVLFALTWIICIWLICEKQWEMNYVNIHCRWKVSNIIPRILLFKTISWIYKNLRFFADDPLDFIFRVHQILFGHKLCSTIIYGSCFIYTAVGLVSMIHLFILDGLVFLKKYSVVPCTLPWVRNE